MPDTLDKLLGMPAESLKRRRSRRKVPKKYNCTVRPERSKEELDAYIREQGFRSRAQLLKGRTGNDPMPYDYMKVYGSWSNAMNAIWHEERNKFDKRYIVKAIVEFGLWARSDYRKARAERPDILPSEYAVEREFGSWGIMKEIAAGMSLRETLVSYIELKQRLGKVPTMEDCRRAGLILEKALKLYGGKRGLDKFVQVMEENL